MNKILLTMTLMSMMGVTYGDDKTPAKDMSGRKEHMQMHQEMAKAHQQAAECLQTDKTDEECWVAFHEMCKSSMGGKGCGHWMQKRGMKKGKK